MVKVLFVCLGNICRSPLAEGIFTKKVEEKGLADCFHIDSCGTSNFHIGSAPDERTIKNAQINGVELNHYGRQFSSQDFDRFDHILAMDSSNLSNILDLSINESEQQKVELMRTYDAVDAGTDVPDPYYGGPSGFQNVFDILDRSCSQLLEDLITQHQLL